MDFWGEIMGAISRNWGKLLGAVLGLIVGIIIIRFGFWKALFLILCLGFGYFIGSRLDSDSGGWD